MIEMKVDHSIPEESKRELLSEVITLAEEVLPEGWSYTTDGIVDDMTNVRFQSIHLEAMKAYLVGFNDACDLEIEEEGYSESRFLTGSASRTFG